MTDHDNIIQRALADLVPLRLERQPDWQDVMTRAGADGYSSGANSGGPSGEESRATLGNRPGSQRSGSKRRGRMLILAVVVMIALTATVLAVGATQGWWFTDAPVPQPAGQVGTVSAGTWDGHDWQLVAYRASTGEICYSLAVDQTQSSESPTGAFSCAILREKEPGMAALIVGEQPDFPAYVAGPVVGAASVVRLYAIDGSVIETKTIPAPESTGLDARFFAVELPCGKYPARALGVTAGGERVADLDLTELAKQQEGLPNRCTSP